MTKIAKSLIALVAVLAAILIWTMIQSADVAAEFKVREEIAMLEIHKADAVVARETAKVQKLNVEVDSLETVIGVLTTNQETLLAIAQAAVQNAVFAETAQVYQDSDSVLVAVADTVLHERRPEAGPISICTDEYGVSRFCMPRLMIEDYITMARVTIPAYKVAVQSGRNLVAADTVLIASLRTQTAALKYQVVSLNTIVSMERLSGSEYENLYQLAESSYRKERTLRKITLYTGGAIIALIAIFK